MERTSKTNYYLNICDEVLSRSTCLRRNYGAIIVKNDEIIATGYNGAPRGRYNCSDKNICYREANNIPSGERYELCRSVHAEQNAIISAGRKNTIESTLYLSGKQYNGDYIGDTIDCCTMCKRFILNAGIEKVIMRTGNDTYKTIDVFTDWINE